MNPTKNKHCKGNCFQVSPFFCRRNGSGNWPVHLPTTTSLSLVQQVPLPGGTTNTHKCIDAAKALFTSSSTGRSGAAKLLLILTDGSPSNQNAAEASAASAIAAGIVIIGVGANVGSWGRPNVIKMTSNQCPSNTGSCSDGLMNPPQCGKSKTNIERSIDIHCKIKVDHPHLVVLLIRTR